MRIQFQSILFTMMLCLFSASLALGASVTISSTGGGAYSVQGDNMDGISGIDLTIVYDEASLSAPTVKWGGLVAGALSTANTTIPGKIRIAIIQTSSFSRSGAIAAITFASKSSSGGITSFSATMIDTGMKSVPVQASIAQGAGGTAAAAGNSDSSVFTTKPGIPFSQSPAPTDTNTVVVTPPPRDSSGTGTVNLGDYKPKNDLPPAESKIGRGPEAVEAAENVPVQQTQQVAEKEAEKEVEKAAKPLESTEMKQTVYSGVLDRFRTFKGERTPENMVSLFTKAVSADIRQEPAVAVSDGKAIVRVTVDQSAIKGASSNFAFTGAKLVSLNKGTDTGLWVLEALPQANALKASVTILNSSSVMEFPLTVVPPAVAVSSKQSDFAAFLKDSGAGTPKHDLNGDGRHDYLDDYIYTGHYLIKSTAAAKGGK
jgi:hypothetical protein